MNGWQSAWQDVREEDISKVGAQLRSGALNVVSGGVLARFEKAFARFAGTGHAVAVNCGTSALYAALHAVGVGPGDDVMMADYSFHGMAAAVLALGARVVVCDVEADGLTLDPQDLARRCTPRAKAVLVHHPWGVPADLAAIRAATDLPIVSDASHAHGATMHGRPLAAFADVTCFSLGYGKLITGGELGCAVTDDAVLADRMMILGHVNRVPGDLKALGWSGNAIGLKLRPHAVALTLALAQLARFPEKQAAIRETALVIETAAMAAGFRLQRSAAAVSGRAYWRILLRPTVAHPHPVDLAEALGAAGIPVEPNGYWPSLQDQAIFAWPGHADRVLRGSCPVVAAQAPCSAILPAPVRLDPEVRDGLPAAFERVRRSLAMG